MVSGLLWLVVAALYVAGWLTAGAIATRQLATRPHCHGESRYSSGSWRSEKNCRELCHPGCWRGDQAAPAAMHAFMGTGLGLIWPLLLPVAAVWLLSQRVGGRRMVNVEQIVRMERELGIEDTRRG